MAGIGFTLKRLAARDNILGVLGAFTHGTIAAAGPWMFTVIALAGIVLLFPGGYNAEDVLNFRETIVYNFSITLMLSGPVYLVVTRYLADSIHRQRVVLAPTVLLQSLALLILVLIPAGLWFYFVYIQLPFAFRLMAYGNLMITGCTWLLGVFVLALKDYMAVSRSFLFGMLIAFLLAQVFKADYGGLGMLIGFSIGQAYILFALIAKVFAEYPYKLATNPTKLHLYYRRYWEMIFAGFFYNAAIWSDKWVMWFCAPEASVLESRFRYFSLYDNATFLALLSIVPAIGLFIFSVETNFFVRYQRFYYDILEHKTLTVIRENHKKLMDSIKESSRNFIVLQGSITVLSILLAAKLFDVFDVSFMELSMFRIAALGAFFHAMMLYAVIILSYFDCRKAFMSLHGYFFLTNTTFTYISIQLGFPFYGYGYFLSALSTFLLAALMLFNHIRKLPYHAFITSNNSLRPTFAGIDTE